MFDYVGGMSYDIHGYSGVLAIALDVRPRHLGDHCAGEEDERMIVSFHKFSIFVWIIWLIPYFSPMVFQMVEAGR